MGNWVSIIATAVASFFAIKWMLPETLVLRGFEFTSMDVFGAVITGLIVGALMSTITEYYCSMGKKPILSLSRSAMI